MGSIPLDPRVMAGADTGAPVVVSDPESTAAKEFKSVAAKVASALDL